MAAWYIEIRRPLNGTFATGIDQSETQVQSRFGDSKARFHVGKEEVRSHSRVSRKGVPLGNVSIKFKSEIECFACYFLCLPPWFTHLSSL